MKFCRGCGETKPASEWHKATDSPDGLQDRCKTCRRKHYGKTRVAHIAGVKRAREARRAKMHEALVAYFREHPCVDCGETDIVLLDFDHVRGKKEFNVSEAMQFALKRVWLEIAKCDVRCVSCHRRKTARERGWWSAAEGSRTPIVGLEDR